MPPEMSIEEWTAQRDQALEAYVAAGRNYLVGLRNIVVLPDGQKRFMQSCAYPDGSSSGVSSPVDEATLATKTCEESWAWKCENEEVAIGNPACPGGDPTEPVPSPSPDPDAVSEWEGICAELTFEEWDAIITEKHAAWEAAGKSTLDGVCAIVGGEFRQYCWYPNGNQGQTSGTGTKPDQFIACDDNWARICGIPEAEGGAQGNPGCPGAEPEPAPAPGPQEEPWTDTSQSPPAAPPPDFAPPGAGVPAPPPTPAPIAPGPGPQAAPFQTGCNRQMPIPQTPLNAFGLGFKRRSMF